MGDLLRSGLMAFNRLRRDGAPGRTADRWGREQDNENTSFAGGSDPRSGGRWASPDAMLGEGLRSRLRSRAASFHRETRRLQGRRRRMLTATAVIVGVSAGGTLLALRWMSPENRPAEPLTIAAQASATPLAERFASEATMEEVAAPLAAAESRRTVAASVAGAEPSRAATASGQDAGEPGATPQEPANDPGARFASANRTAQARGSREAPAGETASVASLEQRFAPADDVAVSADEIREELLTTGSILQPASDRSGRRPAGEEELSEADPLMAALNMRAQAEPARETLADEATETAGGRSPGTVPIPEPRPAVETEVADARPEAGMSDEAVEADPADAGKAGRSGRVTAHVNMRAKPENGATIVSVLTKGNAVEIIECDGWCEVSAGGKTGFVYKSFVEDAE